MTGSDAAPSAPSRPGRTARTVLWVISAYRSIPRRRAGSCRYVPTCSAYAEIAVDHYGPVRGVWLALRRLLRCNPLGSHGYDPVPGVDSSAGVPSTTEDTDSHSDRPSVSASTSPSERAA